MEKKSFQTEKGKKTHNVTNDNIIEVLFFLLLLSKRKLKLFFFNHSLFDFDLRKFQNNYRHNKLKIKIPSIVL